MFHQMADECDEADFPFPNAETIHDGTWQTKIGIKIYEIIREILVKIIALSTTHVHSDQGKVSYHKYIAHQIHRLKKNSHMAFIGIQTKKSLSRLPQTNQKTTKSISKQLAVTCHISVALNDWCFFVRITLWATVGVIPFLEASRPWSASPRVTETKIQRFGIFEINGKWMVKCLTSSWEWTETLGCDCMTGVFDINHWHGVAPLKVLLPPNTIQIQI